MRRLPEVSHSEQKSQLTTCAVLRYAIYSDMQFLKSDISGGGFGGYHPEISPRAREVSELTQRSQARSVNRKELRKLGTTVASSLISFSLLSHRLIAPSGGNAIETNFFPRTTCHYF